MWLDKLRVWTDRHNLVVVWLLLLVFCVCAWVGMVTVVLLLVKVIL